MYMYPTGTELEMKRLQKLYEKNEWTPSFEQPETAKEVPHAGRKRKASQGKQNGDTNLMTKKKATKGKPDYIMLIVHARNLNIFAAEMFSLLYKPANINETIRRYKFIATSNISRIDS